MPLDLGEAVFGSGRTVTYEAGEAISAGDLVAINGGQLATADGTTDTNPVGIAGEDIASGENGAVFVAGVVVANVASGVTAGTELGTSATEGQLGSGSDGYQALTDANAANGLGIGEAPPANAAVVKIP